MKTCRATYTYHVRSPRRAMQATRAEFARFVSPKNIRKAQQSLRESGNRAYCFRGYPYADGWEFTIRKAD